MFQRFKFLQGAEVKDQDAVSFEENKRKEKLLLTPFKFNPNYLKDFAKFENEIKEESLKNIKQAEHNSRNRAQSVINIKTNSLTEDSKSVAGKPITGYT